MFDASRERASGDVDPPSTQRDLPRRVTIATFIDLKVVATLVGYQVKGNWFEKNATTITAFVLIAIGMVAYIGF